jgi:dihydroxy-acid dehydratase
MTMGTASTMACLTEVLGIQIRGAASASAVDARRIRLAEASGVAAVAAVRAGRRPSAIVTRASLRNAVVVNAAIGGSTNAVLHLLAIAGRAGVQLTLDDIDAWSRDVPLLVDLAPSGRFLMPQFDAAGGVPALFGLLGELLDRSCITIEGLTTAELIDTAPVPAPVDGHAVIRTIEDPVQPRGRGIAVLRGSLAPDGAVVKQSAASTELLVHRGRARVFDSPSDYYSEAEDPHADFEAGDVVVLRYAGPRGYPGMPEVGNLPIPVNLLRQGVTDMVRVTDARMSGTAYGTVILHVAPEAALGSPLALVADGDTIEIDIPARRLDLLVDSAALSERRNRWVNPVRPAERGWTRLYQDHVLQADQGVDLDFLVGGSGDDVPRDAF